jgi:hypothetical protein
MPKSEIRKNPGELEEKKQVYNLYLDLLNQIKLAEVNLKTAQHDEKEYYQRLESLIRALIASLESDADLEKQGGRLEGTDDQIKALYELIVEVAESGRDTSLAIEKIKNFVKSEFKMGKIKQKE